jgi:hypothetical protein
MVYFEPFLAFCALGKRLKIAQDNQFNPILGSYFIDFSGFSQVWPFWGQFLTLLGFRGKEKFRVPHFFGKTLLPKTGDPRVTPIVPPYS